MAESIRDWFESLFNKPEFEALGKVIGKKTRIPTRKRPPTTRQPKPNNTPIQYYVNDPSTNDLVLNLTLPKSSQLAFRIIGFTGGGGSSLENQAGICYYTLVNSIDYMLSKMKTPLKRWASTSSLLVVPRAGKDFNAFYDRHSLRFFFDKDPVTQKIIYTSESPDIIAHELGHALLDALRPDFWNIQAMEIWAFHEAFGDINAILSIMQFDVVLERVLAEHDNNLRQSNIISRLAEEMGTAIYNLVGGQHGYLPYALRDAVNNFEYSEPERLSAELPNDQLSSEPHNFSRLWTAAWYEMMIGIYEKEISVNNHKAALIKARDVACMYLLHALVQTPATIRFYDALARNILFVDQSFNSPYQDVIKEVFTRKKILREDIKMLSHTKLSDVVNKGTCTKYNNGTIVNISKIETLSLIDYMGLSIQQDNPLLALNLETPADIHYQFDKDGNLINEIKCSKAEIIDAAFACVNYLNVKSHVGPNDDTPFENQNGKLVRTYFDCCCGDFIDNSKIPGAPEYGKPWKPENNAGCCSNCKAKEAPAPDAPVKRECYSRIFAGRTNSYKVGSTLRRKVC